MSSSGKKQSVWLLVLAVCAVLGAAALVMTRPWERIANEPTIDHRELLVLKNRALGWLENGAEVGEAGGDTKLQSAAEAFAKLADAYPKEELGLRNLCVTILQRLRSANSRKYQVENMEPVITQRASEIAQQLARYRERFPDSYLPDLFEARVQQDIASDFEKAIELYEKAAARPDSTPAAEFQAYLLLDLNQDEASKRRQGALIESAIRKAPRNLVLVAEYLIHLAQNRDARLLQQIPLLRDLSIPMTARTDSEIPALINELEKAIQADDWSQAVGFASHIRNLLKIHVSYMNDYDRLNAHDLDYIQLELDQSYLPVASTASTGKPVGTGASLRFERFKDFPRLLNDRESSTIYLEDFDLDARFDLWLAQGNILSVFNLSDPLPRVLASAELPIACTGIAVGDFDRDFQRQKYDMVSDARPTLDSTDPAVTTPEQELVENKKFLDTDLDLVVYGPEGIRFYRNDYDEASNQRTLTLMPQNEVLENLKQVKKVELVDFDHDSDLDVVVVSAEGVTLWSNRGEGAWDFSDFTAYSSLPPRDIALDHLIALDCDRNVLNDFLVASESSERPIFLENNLHGRYAWKGDGWNETAYAGSRMLAEIDANADACWDIASAGQRGTRLTIMKSPRNRNWSPDRTKTLSTKPAHGLLVEDLDNNGAPDILSYSPAGVEIFLADGTGELPLESSLSAQLNGGKSVASGDIDRDGDIDLVVLLDNGQIDIYENMLSDSVHHLELITRADEDGTQYMRERCNMHGIGNLIELKAGDNYQARIVRQTKTHFGLGDRTSADVMRILWTNGIPNNVLAIKGRNVVFDQQELAGSCPYLYTWNGERFVFCTDCLWAAPIGLQFAQGVASPYREWEYIKIDGEFLKPQNRQYVLQMTEELWEATYYDAVKLLAIDHPAEVSVFSNEKVGPAEISNFKVHTVVDRRSPVSVKQQNGLDVTELVSKRDQRYCKAWERGITQGLVQTHYLEIDLGKLDRPQQVTLFMTGWVFPASTSLNLANTEHPMRPASQPPCVWVPDASGEWREVIPYAGFPGGKTKTIAIDLSGKFLSDDYRIRVQTNMELCWDEVFFTVDDKPGEFRVTEQPFIGADLHFRGYSAVTPRPFHAPKHYEYTKTRTESIWPPMAGAFTRYGDVTEIMAVADDRQVILGAGDEMTMRFQAQDENLPEGWVRDFFIYNVGWDKDADLNTVHGQSVEPLPFRSMKRYPYGADEAFPNTPEHARYLREYQTRVQTPGPFWNQIRDWSARN